MYEDDAWWLLRIQKLNNWELGCQEKVYKTLKQQFFNYNFCFESFSNVEMRSFSVLFFGVAIASTFRDLVMYVFCLKWIFNFQRQFNWWCQWCPERRHWTFQTGFSVLLQKPIRAALFSTRECERRRRSSRHSWQHSIKTRIKKQ